MNSLNLMWHMYVQCDVMISWVLEDPQDWKYAFGGQFYISRAWLRVPCQNMNTHRKLPPTHQKLFKCLRGDLYSSVIHHWNCQLKSNSFPLRKNRVNYGHLWPPVSIRVNKYLKWLILKCDTSFESSAHALLIYTQKK